MAGFDELEESPFELMRTGGMRPHLVITASVETLAGVKGAEPAELEGIGPIANETLQRHACDASVARPQAEPRFRA